MYAEHWGLRESPFPSGLDPHYYFASPTHDEALSRLSFLVENGRRLGLLLGGRGSGKSLLFEVLSRDLRRRAVAVAQVSLAGLETRELLFSLAGQLGVWLPVDTEPFVLWRVLADRLAEHRYQQVPTVLLLDDADLASTETQTNVLRLLQLDPTPEARLTVVLAARGSQAGRLNSRLLDRAELRIEIDRWEEDDTLMYLDDCLSRAGCRGSLFERRAAERLHELTMGVPRQIAQVAELALLAAASQQLSQIDESTIDAVYQELSVSPSTVQELAFSAE